MRSGRWSGPCSARGSGRRRVPASAPGSARAKPIDFECLVTVIELWCKRPDSQAFSAPNVVSLDIATLVSLDWELAVKRANYNEHAARELLSEFVIMLPTMILDIQAYQEMSKFNSVHDNVH